MKVSAKKTEIEQKRTHQTEKSGEQELEAKLKTHEEKTKAQKITTRIQRAKQTHRKKNIFPLNC